MVDKLGWLSDPNRIRAYQGRPRRPTPATSVYGWAQQVADRTSTEITASTVLEITFKSPYAVEAKVGAEEALREAYLSAALATKAAKRIRRSKAPGYIQQAELAQEGRRRGRNQEGRLREGNRHRPGRAQRNSEDMDSGRLAALAAAQGVPNLNAGSVGVSSSHVQLAQLDAQIAQEAKTLGANHPQMQALKAQRAALAQGMAQEDAQARRIASGESGAAALSRVIQEEKARVIGQRDKQEKLRQLQSEVDLRRDQYKTTSARAAELALQASLTDPGLTSMGIVVAPPKPAFPNKPLMVGGAGALGLGLGLGLALLLELLNRRVRGIEDLNLSSELRCIGAGPRAAARRPVDLIRRILGLGPAAPCPAVA